MVPQEAQEAVVSRIEVEQAELEVRTVVIVRVGDVLLFDPTFEALAGEDKEWFRLYSGEKAEVIGFGRDQIDSLMGAAFRFVGMEPPSAEPIIGRLYVRFESGETPNFSISIRHFRVL